jgi:aspartyl-tRNA synthetase
MAPMQLFAEAATVAAQKILVTAKRAGVVLQIAGSAKGTTASGFPVPELICGDQKPIRHTNAILRHVAQIADCGLMGSSFAEEGMIDSWMDWGFLEVEHTMKIPDAPVAPFCEVLEAHLKTRTFLVGQRLTLADVALAVPLNGHLDARTAELKKVYPATIRWLCTCKHQLDLGNAVKAAAAPAKQAAAPAKEAKQAPKAAPAPAPKAEAKASPKAAPKEAPKAAAADEAPAEGGGKNAEKKAKKDAEKKAKEEEKVRKLAEQKAASDAKHKGPDVANMDYENNDFGNMMMQSQRRTDRQWLSVKVLKPDLKDQTVWIRARVHNSRKQGGKLCFLTLRNDLCTVQAVVMGAEMAGYAGNLPDESVVDIFGTIECPEKPITSCSQSLVEVQVKKLFCIGRSTALPLQLADCSRSEAEFAKDPSLVRPGQDARLDNRIIDLRTVANQGIFRIQSTVCHLFREYLGTQGFTEIHTPKMIATASEGGADVFKLDYFDGYAYLAQSPQLYKQAALMSDLPKVFEIGPVFRSEKSFTHRHMTEFTGLDMEMCFKEHYHEVLETLDALFNHIFKGLNEKCSDEIEAVRAQFPFEDLKWKYPCTKFHYRDAVALLKEHGPAYLAEDLANVAKDDLEAYNKKLIQDHLASVLVHEEDEDISTKDEKLLGMIIHNTHGEDFYMIDKFPSALRPFYTMRDSEDDKWANAYDIFLRGEEITSGAQRIHLPEMLGKNAAEIGVDLSPIQWYVDAFKYGAFPHAGGGIGMERVVMLFLKLDNIRKSSMFPRDPKRLTP